MATKKKYLYKVYRDNDYMGLLPQPANDFEYSQDINTAGTQIEIELPETLEGTGADTTSNPLIASTGNYLVTEDGNRLVADKAYVFNTIPIDLANRVKVFLYYENSVNGTQEFDGLITSWQMDYKRGSIKLTALSWGVQLDNKLISIPPNTAIEFHDVYDTYTTLYALEKTASSNTTLLGQSFQLGSTASVSAINLWLYKSTTTDIDIELDIFEGTPGATGSLVATVTRRITNESVLSVAFSFATPVTLNASTNYTFILTSTNIGSSITTLVATDSAGGYPSGDMYYYSEIGGWTSTADDLAFEIISPTETLGNQFYSADPSDIITTLLDNFEELGGVVTYDSTTVDFTNTAVTYNFKFNTILVGIKKCLELAPANWYWYVDIGTNLLHFHQIGSSDDHTIIQGKHVENLMLEYTLEDVRNVVYFSGGDDGTGTNVLVPITAAGSISKYGQWLQLENDNRVTLSETATILAEGIVSQNSEPAFRTELTIPAGAYDIETFTLGEMVGFSGFNDFINSLLLQIVGISRTPDKVTLRLATNPPTQSHRIEDIKRNLDNLYTIDNPEIT